MSRKSEWSDALCIDLTLEERREGPKTISSRWWFKNDGQWLYILARISIAEFKAEEASINYFWPEFVGHWEHSDAGYVTNSDQTGDEYGWDEKQWYQDTSASPPGQNNVEGAAIQDDHYYWYEFMKALNSNDGHDWALGPGDKIGADADAFLIGSGSDSTFFGGNIALQLRSP